MDSRSQTYSYLSPNGDGIWSSGHVHVSPTGDGIWPSHDKNKAEICNMCGLLLLCPHLTPLNGSQVLFAAGLVDANWLALPCQSPQSDLWVASGLLVAASCRHGTAGLWHLAMPSLMRKDACWLAMIMVI